MKLDIFPFEFRTVEHCLVYILKQIRINQFQGGLISRAVAMVSKEEMRRERSEKRERKERKERRVLSMAALAGSGWAKRFATVCNRFCSRCRYYKKVLSLH